MMDARPDPYGWTFSVHGVLFNYGVALLDNALLEPLADACAEEGRYEFMFMGFAAQGGAWHGQSCESDRDVLARGSGERGTEQAVPSVHASSPRLGLDAQSG